MFRIAGRIGKLRRSENWQSTADCAQSPILWAWSGCGFWCSGGMVLRITKRWAVIKTAHVCLRTFRGGLFRPFGSMLTCCLMRVNFDSIGSIGHSDSSVVSYIGQFAAFVPVKNM